MLVIDGIIIILSLYMLHRRQILCTPFKLAVAQSRFIIFLAWESL